MPLLWLFPRFAQGGGGLEVDLLFLFIDVRYDDLNGASESNESPRAEVSDLLLVEIEMISIPPEESPGDESMDSKFKDLYENPEGANLSNQRVVQGSVSAPEFVDEVIAQF